MRNALKVLIVVALAIPTLASAGIANTKHNLSATGTGIHFTDTAADMCKFCHLVHNANTANGTQWARGTPTGAAYTAGSNTAAGTNLDTLNSSLGAASYKCLSCHDGTIALNTVVKNGASYAVAALGSIVGGNTTGGALSGGPTYFASMNGQHPVGIPFATQTASGAAPAEYGTPGTAGCEPGIPACVAGAINDTAGGFIKLYGADGAYQVECGSCHEPHKDNLGGTNPFFLRVSTGLANGQCGSCHIK